MNVRWFIALALVLGVATVSTTSYVWFSRSTLVARDVVRNARVDEQILEQQLVQLTKPANLDRIQGLSQSLHELQLQLVELLSQENTTPGIVSIAFEQSILSNLIPANLTSDVVTLRLVLNLTAQHSVAILNFLSHIRQSVVVWPNEVRACDLQRMPSSLISVQCVIDFYHWSNLGD